MYRSATGQREVPGSIPQMLNVVDVRDVAALALAVLESERYGEPLLAAGTTSARENFMA